MTVAVLRGTQVSERTSPISGGNRVAEQPTAGGPRATTQIGDVIAAGHHERKEASRYNLSKQATTTLSIAPCTCVTYDFRGNASQIKIAPPPPSPKILPNDPQDRPCYVTWWSVVCWLMLPHYLWRQLEERLRHTAARYAAMVPIDSGTGRPATVPFAGGSLDFSAARPRPRPPQMDYGKPNVD